MSAPESTAAPEQSVPPAEPQQEPEPVIIVVEPSEAPKPEPEAPEQAPAVIAVSRDEDGKLVMAPVRTPAETLPKEPHVEESPNTDTHKVPAVVEDSPPETPGPLPEIKPSARRASVSSRATSISSETPTVDKVIEAAAELQPTRRTTRAMSVQSNRSIAKSPPSRSNTMPPRRISGTPSRAPTAVEKEPEQPVIVVANASRKPSKLSFVQSAGSDESGPIISAAQETGNAEVGPVDEVVPVVVKARKRDKVRGTTIPTPLLSFLCGRKLGHQVKNLMKDRAKSVEVSAARLAA